jgi:transposase
MLPTVVITAASIQDRDAARPLLWNLHRACRPIRLIWADAVYTGKLSGWAANLKMAICLMAGRNPHAFEVLLRRWVVERTFAWISKHRRTTRDYERLPASHEAMVLWAMTALMTHRLAQPAPLSTTHLKLLTVTVRSPGAVPGSRTRPRRSSCARRSPRRADGRYPSPPPCRPRYWRRARRPRSPRQDQDPVTRAHSSNPGYPPGRPQRQPYNQARSAKEQRRQRARRSPKFHPSAGVTSVT